MGTGTSTLGLGPATSSKANPPRDTKITLLDANQTVLATWRSDSRNGIRSLLRPTS